MNIATVRETRLGQTGNAGLLLYVADEDLKTCEVVCVHLRLDHYQTSFFVGIDTLLGSLQTRQPDAILVGASFGGTELAALRRIKALHLGAPILALCNAGELGLAVRAMKEGATDIITRPIIGEALIEAVRSALGQKVRLGPVQAAGRSIELGGFGELTPRERQVLELITNGLSNKEAGRELNISPRTIEVHRARVMAKLSARNTADLMRIVLT